MDTNLQMNDCQGKPLEIGDDVIYICDAWTPVYLRRGRIMYFKKVGSNICAYISGAIKGVSSSKVYKI